MTLLPDVHLLDDSSSSEDALAKAANIPSYRIFGGLL
jgi:hypothetical protein